MAHPSFPPINTRRSHHGVAEDKHSVIVVGSPLGRKKDKTVSPHSHHVDTHQYSEQHPEHGARRPVAREALAELAKPPDASDVHSLEQAKVEIVKLRALLDDELRAGHRRCSLVSPECPLDDAADGHDWTNLCTDPDVALRRLKVGNARFVSGTTKHPHEAFNWRKKQYLEGQHPFATVVGCADSRAPIQVLFDAGVGDLFCVTVAGNVSSKTGLASVEYGIGHLKTPTLLVMGHTSCGAVTACIKHAQVEGSIPLLLSLIEPARQRALDKHPHCTEDELVVHTIRTNVFNTVQHMLEGSELIRGRVVEGKLRVEGAIYNIDDGNVDFMGPHPNQSLLLQTKQSVLSPKGVMMHTVAIPREEVL